MPTRADLSVPQKQAIEQLINRTHGILLLSAKGFFIEPQAAADGTATGGAYSLDKG